MDKQLWRKRDDDLDEKKGWKLFEAGLVVTNRSVFVSKIWTFYLFLIVLFILNVSFVFNVLSVFYPSLIFYPFLIVHSFLNVYSFLNFSFILNIYPFSIFYPFPMIHLLSTFYPVSIVLCISDCLITFEWFIHILVFLECFTHL